MRVESAHIKGYRLFEDESISFDDSTTIIVGRNNSGKTSFVELFYKFFGSGKPAKFSVDDFSRNQRKSLQEAANTWQQSQESTAEELRDGLASLENEAIDKLPEITLEIEFSYDDNESATPLADLILDLDPERHDALLSCRYYVKKPQEFLRDFSESHYDDILEFARRRMGHFTCEYTAIDKEDRSNRRSLQLSDVYKALSCDFIYAQTLFDDTALDKGHGLSKGFEQYYNKLTSNEETLDQLEDAIKNISEQLDGEYATLFKSVFDDLNTFGVNGMSALQTVAVRSSFKPETLMKDSTKVFYRDEAGQYLPEAHNGLGFTKLIFIVLQFVSFLKAHEEKTPIPGTSLILIEEPEAHLHPQMQSVFIRSVAKYIESKKWDAQLVITTHSSHIIAESGFKGIRYFKAGSQAKLSGTPACNEGGASLQIKDLTTFRNELKDNNEGDTVRFLEQYMELRRCDMFFADKIILIEGTTERLLLPKMIEKVDSLMGNTNSPLAHSYISLIEVGGAYASKFRELLQFLEVPTLIITDIDSVNPNNDNKKCKTSTPGAVTSNTTLKRWLPECTTITDLLSKDTLETQRECGLIRVCYQIPQEDGTAVGRSFEESFILANSDELAKQAPNLANASKFRRDKKHYHTAAAIRSNAYTIAGKITNKSDFAFDILLLDNWKTPKYIEEGLKWLAQASQSK
ncbi:ATP-dependent endonuclease [Actinomyces oris]|jgi:ATP-dependent OLD family endonuclease|uniref:ATP-dependent nuclease n=1 Tax=Actinomyces oris TaxID=544580 RepID=UPI0028E412E3|nr:ATP-dependent endonuclease [Actinomyces oris]